MYGYEGVAIGVGIISFASIIPLLILKKFVNFSFTTALLPPFLSVTIMGACAVLLSHYMALSWVNLLLTVTTSAIIYFIALKLMAPVLVNDLIAKFTKSIWPTK